ncbi:MAG: MBL fold metallo-hydrolase [Clostridia bacterium]|nr:MBL fold metallo-hydrolase [Clostridia bacterium]
MKITFLGQAGFLLEKDGNLVLIDPYLSDNVKKFQPENYRRQAIDARFLNIKPNALIITHSHLDHYDKETLKHYFTDDAEIVTLTPSSVWVDVKALQGKNNNVLFDVGTSVSFFGLTFYAVKAEHSDRNAIGVVVADGKTHYYFTGDTLYNENVFKSLPTLKFKAVFLPINGMGNNMNTVDAKRFVKRLKVKNVVPCHFGMFDEMTGRELDVKNKTLPEIYKEIILK